MYRRERISKKWRKHYRTHSSVCKEVTAGVGLAREEDGAKGLGQHCDWRVRGIPRRLKLTPFLSLGCCRSLFFVSPACRFSLSGPRMGYKHTLDAGWILCFMLGTRVGKPMQSLASWRLQSSPDIENWCLVGSPRLNIQFSQHWMFSAHWKL